MSTPNINTTTDVNASDSLGSQICALGYIATPELRTEIMNNLKVSDALIHRCFRQLQKKRKESTPNIAPAAPDQEPSKEPEQAASEAPPIPVLEESAAS